MAKALGTKNPVDFQVQVLHRMVPSWPFFCFLTACRTGRLQGAHGGTFTSGGEETPSPWEVSKKEKKPKKGLPGLSNPVLRKQGLGLSVWQGLRIDFTVIQKIGAFPST